MGDARACGSNRGVARGRVPTKRAARAFATLIRQSASPGAAAALARMNNEIDVRHVLSAIRVPTLVMNRAGEHPFTVNASRYLAEHIPGARHVEVPGDDHALFAGDVDTSLSEVEALPEGSVGGAGLGRSRA